MIAIHNIYEYDPEIEGDRVNKVNETADTHELKFSISENLDSDLDDVLNNTFTKGVSEVYIGETSQFLTDVIEAERLKVLMPPNKAYAAMVSEEEAKKKPIDIKSISIIII